MSKFRYFLTDLISDLRVLSVTTAPREASSFHSRARTTLVESFCRKLTKLSFRLAREPSKRDVNPCACSAMDRTLKGWAHEPLAASRPKQAIATLILEKLMLTPASDIACKVSPYFPLGRPLVGLKNLLV